MLGVHQLINCQLFYSEVIPFNGQAFRHPVPTNLGYSSGDIIRAFFNPALAASVRYDRGVGFFSASWLRLAKGMAEFASDSGQARWVTSPILGEADWEALQEGSIARQDDVLKQAHEISIADLRKTLEQNTLSALAWLVADGILDFKLAMSRNKRPGYFHSPKSMNGVITL